MAITGEPDGKPMKVGVALADVIAGKDAAVAVLAGLAGRRRARSAEERRLFISLAQSAVAALVNVAQNALVTGRDVVRWGNAHPNLVPYQLFDASDRSIVIAVGSDAQWRNCMRALGLDELAVDARLRTNAGRLANRAWIVGAIASRVRERTAADWVVTLAAVGVPAGLVRSVREALGDVDASPLTGVAPNEPATIRLPPPMLDEHGTLIRTHGWDAFRRVATGTEASDALHRQ
jgi:crotonobetainyl-CoA:carnitine CoA-transferase CaiB-like acyl-CoA transferase